MIGWPKEIVRVALVFGLCLSASYALGLEASEPLEDRSGREESAPPSKETAGFWKALTHGMILPEINPTGRIVGSKDMKMILGPGDKIYIRTEKGPLAARKEYAVLRDIKKVYHPTTGKYLGHLVQVIGMIETLGMEEKKAVATITRSSDYIERGDLIVSAESLSVATERSSERHLSSLQGTIVGTKENHFNNGQMDIVYIDKGRKDEIAAGDYFKITHRGVQSRFQSEESLPQEEAGGLLILFTQDQTATAQIVESSEPILAGDSIFYPPQNR